MFKIPELIIFPTRMQPENMNPEKTGTEYPEAYNYVDIIGDIEEQDDNKTKKQEYIAIIEERNVVLQITRYFTAGVIRASNDSIAFLLSKKYCHKIADYFINMTCDPYLVIPTEKALKTITITRTKERDEGGEYYVVKLNIDGEEYLDSEWSFPGSQPVEKMTVLEAIIKYPAIRQYI